MIIYLELILAFIQVGAFTFGGGYAALPLIEEQVVEKYGWITIEQYTDIVTMAEIAPGPIAINATTFIGNQVGGILGAICAVFGIVFPSCIIATIIAMIYARYRKLNLMQHVLIYIRPVVIAMILAASFKMLISTVFVDKPFVFTSDNTYLRMFILFVAGLLLLRYSKKVKPIYVIFLCGFAEVIYHAFGFD